MNEILNEIGGVRTIIELVVLLLLAWRISYLLKRISKLNEVLGVAWGPRSAKADGGSHDIEPLPYRITEAKPDEIIDDLIKPNERIHEGREFLHGPYFTHMNLRGAAIPKGWGQMYHWITNKMIRFHQWRMCVVFAADLESVRVGQMSLEELIDQIESMSNERNNFDPHGNKGGQ